jgi:hypothetical protein
LRYRNILVVSAFLIFILVATCSQAQNVQEPGETALPAPGSYPQPQIGSPISPNTWTYPYPDSEVSTPDTTTNQAPAYPEPWQPAPGDENMQRGNIYIDKQEILVMESFPPQFKLSLKGNLPTPCHQLRVQVKQPDQENRIQVEVYSLVKPGEICIQVLEVFEVQAPLEDLPSGHFTVYVNGDQVGEIDN